MIASPDKVTSVLVVEDDVVLLEIVTELFGLAGLRVYAAPTGEEALTLLRENGQAIDWLFTDVRLPGVVDGWVVASEYRMSHPTRPIIYSSSAPHPARRFVHGSIFVEKPFDPTQILDLARLMGNEHLLVAADEREPPRSPALPGPRPRLLDAPLTDGATA